MGGRAHPRRKHWRLLTHHLTAASLLGALAISSAPSAVADSAPPAGGNAIQTALLQAQSTGQSVSVDSLTSQTATTVANPDGTLTTTEYVRPVRVRKNGSWTPLDATLQQNTDGSFSPAATPSGVTLSGGGSGPLVTLTDPAGRTLSFAMPFALPTPTVNGSTATYASVLPGVDLEASVTEQGDFSEVLIVHDASAATNPALRKLTLAASTQGLTLSGTAAGGLTATASDGTTAYTSAAPIMWDSTSTGSASSGTAASAPSSASSSSPAASASASTTARGTATASTSGSATASATVTGSAQKASLSAADTSASASPSTPTATSSDPSSASSADGPGAGAEVAPVAMTTTSSGLTLAPAASMLTSSSTTWPVYIDPGVSTSQSNEFFEAQQGCDSSSSSAQEFQAQRYGEGVGYQRYDSSGGECIGAERTFYQLVTSNLNSSMHIYSSYLNLTETYAEAYSCSHTAPVTLKWTNMLTSGMYWDTQPSVVSTIGTQNPSSAYNGAYVSNPTSCGNQSVKFTVTSQVQSLASQNASTWTVGLYGNEDSSSSDIDFMRYSTNPYMTTTYDIPPDVPSSTGTTPDAQNPSGANCGSSSRGWIGLTTLNGDASSITLNARLKSNVSGENVMADYTVWDDQTANSGGNATTVSTPSSGYVASGTTVATNIGTTVQDGHQYGWEVRAYDGSLYSGWTGACGFKVDLTPPTQASVTTASTVFPPSGSGQKATGYAGQSSSIAVTSQDPVPTGCTLGSCLASGVWRFCYGLDSQPAVNCPNYVTASANSDGTSSASVPLNPTTWGTHTLYIQAQDYAGNLQSYPTTYTFYAPWNAATKVTAGDLTGDGVPDLLGTTKSGNLVLLPGNTDAGNTPTIASTPAGSPDGKTGWNNYLLTHRGSIIQGGVDDLLAYNKSTHNLFAYKNDASANGTAGHFTLSQDIIGPLAKPQCSPTADNATNCASYNATDWSSVTQIIAPGNVYKTSYPDLITVENNQLWLYKGSPQTSTYFGPASGGTASTTPVLLGTGDWSHFTLIAPGTANSTPTLWARDNNTGTLYTFPLTLDNNGLPPLLTAPVSAPLTSGVNSTLCVDDLHSATTDGNAIQIWGCNSTQAQSWTRAADGSIRVLGKCLDVKNSGTANGTLVDLYTCNGSSAQQWKLGSNNSLVSQVTTATQMCLDDPNSSTTAGTQLQIYTCNGSNAQSWTSSTPSNWNTTPANTLPITLDTGHYPTIASPGDVNSPTTAGTPDGYPDLYVTTPTGQLIEYPGAAPNSSGAATFTSPQSVGYYNAAAAAWALNDGSGTTAADSIGTNNATLNGAATWATDSTRGTVLNLTGTTGYAASTSSAVPTGTYTDPVDGSTTDNRSFSVSAWVKLNNLSTNSTFVSQSDTAGNANAFQLYYSSGAQVWAFNRHNDDTTGTSFTPAYGLKGQVQAGVWTHLVGVYDGSTNTLSLYVNGQLSATNTFSGTPWDANGPVQIGRRLYQGSYGEYANAEISNVQLFGSALSASAVGALDFDQTPYTQLS